MNFLSKLAGAVYDDQLFLLHDIHPEVFDPETLSWNSWPRPPPVSPDQVSWDQYSYIFSL